MVISTIDLTLNIYNYLGNDKFPLLPCNFLINNVDITNSYNPVVTGP